MSRSLPSGGYAPGVSSPTDAVVAARGRRAGGAAFAVVVAAVAGLSLVGTSVASAARDKKAPSPPANVRGIGATASSVDVSWDASTDNVGVVGYIVYVNGQPLSSGKTPTVAAPPYTVDGLECGESVKFAVAAVDGAGNKSVRASVVVSAAACADTSAPSAPANFRQEGATATSVALAWDASTDDVAVAGYGVYVGGIAIGTAAGPSFTVTGLTCGATSAVEVDAFDAAGNRSPRAMAWVTTVACGDLTPPSAPGNLAVGTITATSVALAWAASSDNVAVAGYNVYRNGAKVGSVSGTSFADTNLTCGTSYSYGVEAYDAAANTSTRSTTTAVTAACVAPTAEPAPIAGQGYRKVFGDEFDSFDRTVWSDHAFWDSSTAGAVAASNGVLNIVSRRADGYPDIHVSSGPEWFQGSLRKNFMFGYFEARMRFTAGKGSWPAFWLSSLAHATAPGWPSCPEPDLNYELDVMEFQGDEPYTFYGTQHRNTGGVCGVGDQTRSTIKALGFPLAGSAWHTWSVLWTAGAVSYYADGQLIGSGTLFDSGDQQMYLLLSMQSCGWDSTNSCDASTPNDLRTEVDYVRVWQK